MVIEVSIYLDSKKGNPLLSFLNPILTFVSNPTSHFPSSLPLLLHHLLSTPSPLRSSILLPFPLPLSFFNYSSYPFTFPPDICVIHKLISYYKEKHVNWSTLSILDLYRWTMNTVINGLTTKTFSKLKLVKIMSRNFQDSGYYIPTALPCLIFFSVKPFFYTKSGQMSGIKPLGPLRKKKKNKSWSKNKWPDLPEKKCLLCSVLVNIDQKKNKKLWLNIWKC